MRYVVDKEWLLKNLNDQNVRIVDCRFSLADKSFGLAEYKNGHLPGAVFFDLEKDLSGSVSEHGGRHPLPDLDQLISKLEVKGIDNETTIIAYDQGDGQYAARFWWLLRYLGHEKVFVLDGGYREWVKANFPNGVEEPAFEKANFKHNLKDDWLITVDEVKKLVRSRAEEVILIDSREFKRYLGIEEPIDKKAGHIPGAINKPWMDGITEHGYKSADQQKERFSDLSADKELIVYCGSGVTAVPNFLALKEAGYDKVKLYLGSFSDWISYPENEIE